MTTQELLRAAELNRPVLMKKTAMAVAVLERLNPQHAKELVEELNEITDHTMTKVAASPMGVWGAAVGGTLLAGLAGSLATDLYDSAKRGITRTSNFKAIMAANPELKKYDKKRIDASFTALHRYAPEFTADPILGGTLLKAVAEVPGNEHVIIKDLIASRKNLQEAKHVQYRPGTIGMDLESNTDIANAVADRSFRSGMEDKRQQFESSRDSLRADRDQASQRREFDHQTELKGREFRGRLRSARFTHEMGKALEDYKKSEGHIQYQPPIKKP